MSKAKDKQQYISTWNSHITKLSYLGNPLLGTGNLEELIRTIQRLKELVKIAADEDFKDE